MTTPEVTPDPNIVQEKIDSNPAPSPIENKPEEVKEDPNWKVVRELRKKEKAEREEAQRRAAEEAARADALAKALEKALEKSHIQQQNYAAYPEEETEDQRIERMVQAAIAKRTAQEEALRAERERNELPNRLAQAYPDYHQIVNEDNGAYLEYHHPELYRSLTRLPENFETCSDIYKLVKKLVPNANSVKKDEIKAEVNFNKPKSMSTTSLTPTGEPISSLRLSEEKKAQNWERMQKLLRGLS